jgi:hypothetical protein
MRQLSCTDCERDRSRDPGVDNDQTSACPNCGSIALTINVVINDTMTITDEVTVGLVPGEQERDWRLRWSQLEARLPAMSRGHTETTSVDAIQSAAQDLFEFLVAAYHLKDALIADGAVPKADVEGAINVSPTLQLLADLANQEKHRRLGRPPRSGAVPTDLEVSSTSTGGAWHLVSTFEHDGVTVDAVAFAAQVVGEWHGLLRAWGLS